MSKKEVKPSANEGIKERSNYLRGTIAEGLQDLSTGGISADDQQLIKFHKHQNLQLRTMLSLKQRQQIMDIPQLSMESQLLVLITHRVVNTQQVLVG